VRLVECGEDLTTIQSGARIWVQPAYYALGYETATNVLQLRIGTVDALRRAIRFLPNGISIILWDGFRTLATQREITERFRKKLSLAISSARERECLIRRYISPLPTSETEWRAIPPPHSTGGAVDLTLGNDRGQPLDMGAEFDQFDEVSSVTHYERDIDNSSALDQARREMRRILYWSMTRAGFAPYPFEFWHFEYRTRRAAAFYGHSIADYGPAVPFKGLLR
jgi:D-alanyl-D-alanine dipeptidase